MTLEEALGIAYETNPELAAAQAGLRASDEQVAQANGAWRPTISIGATYGVEKYFFPIEIQGNGTLNRVATPLFTPSGAALPNSSISTANASITDHPLNGQATISQPIFRSGRTIAEIGRAKALVRSGRAQLIATEQTVLLNAATAYMNAVRDGAIVKLREHNVEVLRRQRDSTQLEFKAGSLTRTDVAQSEARLAIAQSDLVTARGQLASSRADFLQTIGRPAEALQSKPDLPKMPSEQEAVLDSALKQNPALVTAKENERAAEYAVDDAWGAMGPTLSVQGQYQLFAERVKFCDGIHFGWTAAIGAGTCRRHIGSAQRSNLPGWHRRGEYTSSARVACSDTTQHLRRRSPGAGCRRRGLEHLSVCARHHRVQ
ncbi:MAG: TolC family protein [Rhizomicrobium sp.]